MSPFVLIVLASVGLVVALIFYFKHLEKKRREAVEQVASDLGLVFEETNEGLRSRFGHFKLFNSGHSKKLYNVIAGDSGEVKISIFDYRYTTGGGKHQHTHIQTVAALQSSELSPCPSFRMRPENFMDRIGSAIGFQDIDFDDHKAFSDMFVLQGENEEAIREFFTIGLLNYFAAHKGICVESSSGAMFFYRPGKRVKPEEMKDLLSQAYEVFGHMVDPSQS